MAAPISQEMQITRGGGRFTAQRCLLNAAQGNTTGQWFDTLLLHPFTVCIMGTFSADVTVYVSNGVPAVDATGRMVLLLKPDDADNAHPFLGPNPINNAFSVGSDGPYRFVKVAVANWQSGAVSAGFGAATNVTDKA